MYYIHPSGSIDTACIMLLAQKEMYGIAKNVERFLNDDRFSCHEITQRTIFNNGELCPRLGPCDTNPDGIPVRNKKIFLFHSLRYPKDPNNSFMEMMLTVDALVRASVEDITLVVPYMCYTKQEKKDQPRSPISFAFIANVIQLYPQVKRILTMDLHVSSCQGFFKIPVDELPGGVLSSLYLRNSLEAYLGDNVVAVAPDQGAAKRTQKIAQWCQDGLPMVSFDKRRGPKGSKIVNFIGERSNIVGKTAVIFDDEVDTGGSSIDAGNMLLEFGARDVYLAVTHWVASEKDGITAEERFSKGPFSKVLVTNSIPRTEEYYLANPYLTLLTIDEFLAKAIYRLTLWGGSASKLFNVEK